jgi:nitrogen fixation protein FixH
MHGKTRKYEGMRRTYMYAALPALGQGAPWPTRVTARAGSQTFYEVVNLTILRW